ncbi:[protein-PII] uridylyltransferase [Rhodococcus erythropolis]|jgi:[protein-PII] uridylyltransferase|uniref:Bifunctional uridylyltransferase/uridylyl-removing enzyme n=2 Tax=Rhodococcus erythropolis TaxID=1833 RepID=C0ZXR4_RHOE4|nr:MULTISPECIES: [protein-PII] uridylyltransferase [Rhodococcus]MCD2154927.1 [protein-PII] uridylyltransferase [Rhodococcus cerastii]AKE00621.1 protein-PII uridylyltransferase [Rhodococcus erythropolis]ALU71528.1 protein-PII uridylyltransferase [Rhodococcus erythropolis R138]MBO8147578.1 [protein-PII] uridylyltransferase [Rhodococcus erythropolis]MBS2988347.1 [protein-PII] uridylyltransferase [Rhodococcus erythropolis]
MHSDPKGSENLGPGSVAKATGPGPVSSGGSDEAADLARARKALLTGGVKNRRLDAPSLRHALVDLHEFWLTTKGTELGIKPDCGFAIVAVGGLGRRELLPYSDLDLILLHDDMDPAVVAQVADSLWYPLWDAHIKLDHSVRTLPQALQVAATDMTAALGMLEARHIAGDVELSNLLISGVRRQWRMDIRSRFDELITQTRTRWERSGEIAHRAEPDLKSGRGGLRDVQLLNALSIAQLTDGMPGLGPNSPGGGLALAHRRLLDVRTELHRVAGRARDQLRAQDADEIGAALRIGDRFDLARLLSESARTISYSVDVGIRTAGNSLPRRGLSRLRRAPVRRPLDEGVVEHAGEVVLARDARPKKDPGLVMRVAAAAATNGMPISASTLNRLADNAPELREPWPKNAVNDLLVVLGSGSRAVPVIEAMDRTGLWGRLLPEWGTIRDLPPRDAVHTWTVDRHLVETAAYASGFTTRVARPDLLMLGALIHDIGKGRGGDHSVVGAELATAIGNRLGLWPSDVATLTAMVRYHLLLPETATRRDLDDPATVQRVVDALEGDGTLLDLLHSLAEADSLATGPGVWGDWKSSLIGELVRRCRLLMAGEELPQPDPLAPEQLAIAEDGGVHVSLVPAENPHTYVVTVIAPDAPGLLSRAAGVLALQSLRVHSASLGSHAGSAVNSFVVTPRFGTPPQAVLLRQELIRASAGELNLLELLDAKDEEARAEQWDDPIQTNKDSAVPVLYSQAPPRVIWFDAPGDGHAILELRTEDRVGLLCRLAAALEHSGADIRWAKVATLGSSVVDAFCLDFGEADTRAARERVEEAVLAVVPVPQPKKKED